jgi:hypothetical protein
MTNQRKLSSSKNTLLWKKKNWMRAEKLSRKIKTSMRNLSRIYKENRTILRKN